MNLLLPYHSREEVVDQSFFRSWVATVICAALIHSGLATADERVGEILEIQQSATTTDQNTQLEVEKLADETQDAVNEYRIRLLELDRIRRYNNNLEQLVADQNRERQSLNRQISEFGELEQGIVPLLMDMVDDLDRFIAHDLPFRIEQRVDNVRRLTELLNRADVTIAEKYRQIMASYQDEVAIGRNIESFTGELNIDGELLTVDFLRVGRVLLAYQTPDREQAGYWHTRAQEWRPLERKYWSSVTRGIRIARSLIPPDILVLPVTAPQDHR